MRRSWPIIGLLAAPVWAQQDSGYRVAAIIDTEAGSRVLIEDSSRKQSWFRVGDRLGDMTISRIIADGIIITSSDGEFRLDLQGDSTLTRVGVIEPPPTNAARTFRYANLLSILQSVDPGENESTEQATTRTLNRALGLSVNARITAVAGEPVNNSIEARKRLLGYLTDNHQVDVSIEGDQLESMYVLPSE